MAQLAHFLCSASTSDHQACVFETMMTLMNHFNLLDSGQFSEIICKSQLELPLIILGMCLFSEPQ